MEFVQPQVPDLSQITQQMMQIKDHKKRQDLMDIQMQQANMQLADMRRNQIKQQNISDAFQNSILESVDSDTGELDYKKLSSGFTDRLAGLGYTDEFYKMLENRQQLELNAKAMDEKDLRISREKTKSAVDLATQVFVTTLTSGGDPNVFMQAHEEAVKTAQESGLPYPADLGDDPISTLKGFIVSGSEANNIIDYILPHATSKTPDFQDVPDTVGGKNVMLRLMSDPASKTVLSNGQVIEGYKNLGPIDKSEGAKAKSEADLQVNLVSTNYKQTGEWLQSKVQSSIEKRQSLQTLRASLPRMVEPDKFGSVKQTLIEYASSIPGGERFVQAFSKADTAAGAEFNMAVKEMVMSLLAEQEKPSDADREAIEKAAPSINSPEGAIRYWIDFQDAKLNVYNIAKSEHTAALGKDIDGVRQTLADIDALNSIKTVKVGKDKDGQLSIFRFDKYYAWVKKNSPNISLGEIINGWNERYGL